MENLLKKIEDDFRCGGRLGPKSTANVLLLLRQMHDRISDLERESRAARAGLRLPSYN